MRSCETARRIERNRRPEPQVPWKDEQFERIGFRHREGGPTALREADRGHPLRIDEGLASQERETTIGIWRAPASSGEKTTPGAGLFYAARCKAIDEQDDKAPGDKLIS